MQLRRAVVAEEVVVMRRFLVAEEVQRLLVVPTVLVPTGGVQRFASPSARVNSSSPREQHRHHCRVKHQVVDAAHHHVLVHQLLAHHVLVHQVVYM